MRGKGRTTPAIAPEEASGARLAAVPAPLHAFLLFGIWVALAALFGLILWRDAMQPRGILSLTNFLGVLALQRLVPLALLTLGALAFALVLSMTRLGRTVAALPALLLRHRRLAAWGLIGFGTAAALVVVWVLRAFPNSGDEYAYLFEAKTFLAGRLWNSPPPLPWLFEHFHIIIVNGKWVAGYAPGWPLILAAVIGLHLPSWLAGPLAGGLLLFATFKLGQRRDGAIGGILATALVALSPFFIFNAASYFDMVPATAAGLLFCWAALAFLERPRLANALAAGLALGALGLIRSQDVPLLALPFAVAFLWRARGRHYRFSPAILLAGLPFLAALLLYRIGVFGSPLPSIHLQSQYTRFGLFPVTAAGAPLTPLDELYFVVLRLVMLAEWSSPLLVLVYLAAFRFVWKSRRLGFLDFIFPTFVLGFMVVPFTGGNEYGPRYYFEGFPFLVLTIVSALAPWFRETEWPRWRAFLASLVLAYGANCLAALPVLGVLMREVVDQRMDVYDQVRAAHLRNAVVVLGADTGVIRLMQRLDLTRNGIAVNARPVLYVLDIPAQLAELRYRFPQRRFYLYERAAENPKGSLEPLP